jgi:hypothetical protein
MSDDDSPEPAAAVAALVDELIRLGAGLTLIIDHMARAARSAPPDADPVDVVLRRLLCGVLLPELGDLPASAVATTAVTLGQVCETIGRDLFLVELPPPPRPRDGRPSARRRPHARRRPR